MMLFWSFILHYSDIRSTFTIFIALLAYYQPTLFISVNGLLFLSCCVGLCVTLVLLPDLLPSFIVF